VEADIRPDLDWTSGGHKGLAGALGRLSHVPVEHVDHLLDVAVLQADLRKGQIQTIARVVSVLLVVVVEEGDERAKLGGDGRQRASAREEDLAVEIQDGLRQADPLGHEGVGCVGLLGIIVEVVVQEAVRPEQTSVQNLDG